MLCKTTQGRTQKTKMEAFGGNEGTTTTTTTKRGARWLETKLCSQSAYSSLSPGTQREHWSVAGERPIVSQLLTTLSTQSLMCSDFDLCWVFTWCPYCTQAAPYRDNGTGVHGFTNQWTGADLNISLQAVIIDFFLFKFNNGWNDIEMLLDTAQTAAHIPCLATCHLTGLACVRAIIFLWRCNFKSQKAGNAPIN